MKKNDTLFGELYLSFLECSKNKSWTINAINFLIDKERKLISLKQDLENFSYKPGKSIYFIVLKPKIREVFAADFRDRIIHHFFIRWIEKNFYKELTNSSYSSLRWRWTHLAIKNIKKIYWNYEYYLQVDIKNFFMTIDKKILKEKIKKYLPKNTKEHINKNIDKNFDLELYPNLLNILLGHNPVKNCIYRWDKNLKKLLAKEKSLFNLKDWKWMAIWNYSSQFFANIYLNDLDKYILWMWYKDYFRYSDDLVIFWNNYKQLEELEGILDNYLKENLSMSLARWKTKLKQTDHWLDFLWFFIKKHCSYVRKRVVHNFIEKIDSLKNNIVKYIDLDNLKIVLWNDNSKNIIKTIDFSPDILNNAVQVVSSYVWHLTHADATNLLKKILYKNSFLQYYFDFSWKKHKYLKIKKFKNKNIAYSFYDKIYNNTIMFFWLNNYYIFKKKYLFLLDLIWKKSYLKSIIIYKNIWFKIKKEFYKLFLLDLLKLKSYNIVVINSINNRYHIKKFFHPVMKIE